ncbi:MAG: cyclic dehypoxanthinyl futalosine synthase [Bacteroidota bacterium]|nr:cyclic dehypoxanthinyl futalosine synthase [Bacteroidota bacterium]
MNLNNLYQKALNLEFLSAEEGLYLYREAPTTTLMQVANQIRQQLVPGNTVTWMIDRNVNITNVCISQCKFCNFCRVSKSAEAYITTLDEYKTKVDEMFAIGGDQLLLQGGMHPNLGLSFYTDLFRQLKKEYPRLKLHALGPPEVHYIAKKDNLSYHEVLTSLVEAGLESLPGAGAEILTDRVRKIVSPAKATTGEWLDVMREAHRLNLPTSATMMFGHIETEAERIEHLINIRQVQSEKPKGHYGFIAFIPWPFQDENTVLRNKMQISNTITAEDYIRLIAISRIMLPNVNNIQSSWLTVGKQTAQITLHGGANDFGSIMIEEHVVSSAGANHAFDANGIQQAIREAGFVPQRRNQKYELMETK